MKEEIEKSILTSLLPQYQASAAIMSRFLVAAHEEGAELQRAINRKGVKAIDLPEVEADMFSYFSENKADLEQEFMSDLSDEIGPERSELFCEIISTDWYDGKPERTGPKVTSIRLALEIILSQCSALTKI